MVIYLKTIKNKIINEIIVNKSKFICILCMVNSKEEVKTIIEECKKNYKDATHYCFAYIIDGEMKCFDDGEPSGTAGMPILNVLKNNKLNHVLCLVIRYFGGIKLGAGGLVRAYTNSSTKALEKAQIADLLEGYFIEIEFDYDDVKTIDGILKNIEVRKEYNEKIKYSFKISKVDFDSIDNLINKYAIIIKKEPILICV